MTTQRAIPVLVIAVLLTPLIYAGRGLLRRVVGLDPVPA